MFTTVVFVPLFDLRYHLDSQSVDYDWLFVPHKTTDCNPEKDCCPRSPISPHSVVLCKTNMQDNEMQRNTYIRNMSTRSVKVKWRRANKRMIKYPTSNNSCTKTAFLFRLQSNSQWRSVQHLNLRKRHVGRPRNVPTNATRRTIQQSLFEASPHTSFYRCVKVVFTVYIVRVDLTCTASHSNGIFTSTVGTLEYTRRV